MDRNREFTKKYLETVATKLYARFKFLHTQSLDDYKKELVGKYLDSGLSIEQINPLISQDIEKLRFEDRKKQIISFTEEIYNKCSRVFHESLGELKEKVLNRYLNSEMSIDQIKKEMLELLQKLLDEDERKHNPDIVKANHEEMYSKLEKFVSLLQEANIDYFLAGALCGYIKYGEESNRIHEDLDILVNENDIEKLGTVCEKMGLNFSDNRFDSPRVLKNGIPSGEHEIIATQPGSDFHIGAFAFQRLNDGSMITKGYYKGDNGEPRCRQEIINANIVNIIYGDAPVNFRGHELHITAPEYIYSLKGYTNHPKDREDIKFLDSRIDKEKLQRFNELKKENTLVQHVDAERPSVKTEPVSSNNELSEMFADKPKAPGRENDIHKQYVKKDTPKQNPNPTNKESGSISIFNIGLALLVMTGLILIAMILNVILK